MSKAINPFHTFEVVVTNKLQLAVSHQIMHASAWRIEYFVSDYKNSKDYKGYSVWIRRQLNSSELSDNSGWHWDIKAKNSDEARDYAALVEWEPWVNVTKEQEWVRELVIADNETARVEQEKENQNATR